MIISSITVSRIPIIHLSVFLPLCFAGEVVSNHFLSPMVNSHSGAVEARSGQPKAEESEPDWGGVILAQNLPVVTARMS